MKFTYYIHGKYQKGHELRMFWHIIDTDKDLDIAEDLVAFIENQQLAYSDNYFLHGWKKLTRRDP